MSDLVLVFTGQPRAGLDLAKAKAAFGRSFSLSSSQLEGMFKRAPVPVKKGLDKNKAHTFVKKLWKLGWHSEIHRAGQSIYSTNAISAKNDRAQVASPQRAVEAVIKSVCEEASAQASRAVPVAKQSVETAPQLTRKLVSMDQDIKLYVPGSWHEATQLNPMACIQAGCVESDAYLVVVPQFKDKVEGIDSVELYAHEIIQHSSALVNPAHIDASLTQLDHPKHKCMYAELTGTHEDRKIRYILAVFESDNCYYTLYIWAAQEKAEKLKDLMLSVIRSTQINAGK